MEIEPISFNNWLHIVPLNYLIFYSDIPNVVDVVESDKQMNYTYNENRFCVQRPISVIQETPRGGRA